MSLRSRLQTIVLNVRTTAWLTRGLWRLSRGHLP
jgi:hypothetical protein